MQCTVCSAHCTILIVQCKWYTAQRTLYNARCTLHNTVYYILIQIAPIHYNATFSGLFYFEHKTILCRMKWTLFTLISRFFVEEKKCQHLFNLISKYHRLSYGISQVKVHCFPCLKYPFPCNSIFRACPYCVPLH